MLASLVERVSQARGAVFCDHEGESVELVIRDSTLAEYEMKVAGAQLAAIWLNLHDTVSGCGAGAVLELQVACAAGTLLCRSLPDGYYVVLLLGRGGSGASAAFALRSAARQIAAEL
jgi:hypothetical protein